MSQITNYGNGSGPGSGNVRTLTGNTGGAVPPDSIGNIDILGTDGITVTGNIGSHTLTIDGGGTASTFVEDAGTAHPIAGVININGINNIVTSGDGSNHIAIGLTMGLDGQVLIGATAEDAAWANITSLDSSITITNGPNTIDLSASGGSGVTTFDTDSGTATPSMGVIDIAGGLNINTAGATNVVTINLDTSINLPDTTADLSQGAYILNGVTFLSNFGGTGGGGGGNANVFVGGSGNVTLSTGSSNFGGGLNALESLDTGQSNIGIGVAALQAVTSGISNIGIGLLAGSSIFNSNQNISIGDFTMQSVQSGTMNVALGSGSMGNSANDASYNVAIGAETLGGGCANYNIAIGYQAGMSLASDVDGSNIYIGNVGSAAESHVIRIGTQGSADTQQDLCYVAGIYGVSVGATNEVVFIDDTGNLGSSTGTDGQVIIGSSSGSPQWANITPGTNVTITNAANSITINATGGGGVGLAWFEVTTSTQALAVNSGYIMNNGGGVTGTLPATAAIGDIVAVVGKNAGGWIIAQNSGQTIHYGEFDTTTGAGGTLSSTMTYDCVELVCIAADTDWVARSSIGNLAGV